MKSGARPGGDVLMICGAPASTGRDVRIDVIKKDLGSCGVSSDGGCFFRVPDPSFLWRSALTFSFRMSHHAKRGSIGHVGHHRMVINKY